MQKTIKTILRHAKKILFRPKFNSGNYWEQRYVTGYTSGDGSYGELAQFKAEVINRFVREHHIQSVIEYGCGDGNQLQLLAFPSYLGFDVSSTVIQRCQKQYAQDPSKSFKIIQNYRGESAELTLSLDVLYHLVEEPIYHEYLERLFASAQAHVIVYSSNFNDDSSTRAPHVQHRCFTDWVTKHYKEWQLTTHIANPYPNLSSADFYLYSKVES